MLMDGVAGSTDDHESDFGALTEIARAMHVPSGDLDQTLDAITRAAVAALDQADDAGLILISKDRLTPVAATGLRPERLDELQQRLGTGPCFDTARSQQVTLVAELQRDPRWAELHEAAVELGVVSLACVPLRVGSRTTGALTLYSAERDAFDGVDLSYVELFATLAALALADAQRADQLRTALASRDVLGQAKGILMERFRIDADEAFTRLSTASQVTNTKVTVVAEHLVATGELLAPGSRPR